MFTTDRFVRDSAPAPVSSNGVQTQVDPNQPRAFYGSERATPPPPGYVPTLGATGGYVATDRAVLANDIRNRSLNLGLDSTARPGELMLPSMDQASQITMLSASPLYGVRVWQNGTVNPYSLPGDPLGAGAQGDRFGNINSNSILQMRDEINRAANLGDAGGLGQGQGQGQGQQPGQSGAQQTGLGQPIDLSLNRAQSNGTGTNGNGNGANGNGAGQNQATAIQADAISTQLGANAIGGESGQTNQSMQRRLVLAPADKQTPQLADLRRQFERRHGTAPNDVEANREFNLEFRTRTEAKAKADAAENGRPGGAGGKRPGGAGGAGGIKTPDSATPPPARSSTPATTEPGQPNTAPAPAPEATPGAAPAQPEAAAPQVDVPAGPVRINSMADNVQAKGLRDLLTSAETLMRQEKYAAALDKYNTAQEVAPNNPMIGVGRAHAELAASYYRRAETDLRDALAKAPELAEAQFDLKSLVGPDRLQVIVKDLKDLADTDKTQARPLLLLAYIAYHTGNADQAATYLDAAQKRVQGEDSLIKAWRGSWTLPKSGASDLNK
jgi:tetratricopeptide (TPR) repeat protein